MVRGENDHRAEMIASFLTRLSRQDFLIPKPFTIAPKRRKIVGMVEKLDNSTLITAPVRFVLAERVVEEEEVRAAAD
jgi:hypothetical protein